MSDGARGSPFLSYGFRPFFLFAGVYAVLAMAAWIAWIALHWMNGAVLRPTFAGPPHLWHGHEMIFGYASAVISGFLLTAVPSWTGAKPISGTPLAALAGLWLAGRAAMWFSALLPPLVVAVVDWAYLPALATVAAKSLVMKPAPRNLVFLALLGLLAVANAAVHLEWLGQQADSASWGLSLAILTVSLMMVIVGGRIVPAFTRNTLISRGETASRLPVSHPRLEIAAMASTVALVACYLASLPDAVTGMVALLAGLANLLRLAFWRSAATLQEPILWSLHLGYGFIPLGYLAIASARLMGFMPETAAIHLLAVGAVGVLTLAVMSRAALGHTGRPLVVAPTMALSYGAVALAAIVRAFGPQIPGSDYFLSIFLAGGLWMGGFALFAAHYLPVFIGPKKSPNET
jgi:uncharacterized protein involved in response to NO